MTYINCNHPINSLTIKAKKQQTLDVLAKYNTPRVYCKSCNSYLPSRFNPGNNIIDFWFAHDGRKASFKLCQKVAQ